jgi:hypothetical protein
MLVAIFYPLLDGGIQQIRQVYQGLTGRANIVTDGANSKIEGEAKYFPPSPSTESTSEGPRRQAPKGEAI